MESLPGSPGSPGNSLLFQTLALARLEAAARGNFKRQGVRRAHCSADLPFAMGPQRRVRPVFAIHKTPQALQAQVRGQVHWPAASACEEACNAFCQRLDVQIRGIPCLATLALLPELADASAQDRCLAWTQTPCRWNWHSTAVVR